jgi:hypothetical protein
MAVSELGLAVAVRIAEVFAELARRLKALDDDRAAIRQALGEDKPEPVRAAG